MASFTVFRITGVLLLLLIGVQAYACEVSEACVTDSGAQNGGCDQPGGDNCLCCCHHVVPAAAVALPAAEDVWESPPPEAAAGTVSVALSIEHPPQL